MIENYTKKIFFVNDKFLEELKLKSVTDYEAFDAPEVDIKIISLPLASAEINILSKYVEPSEMRAGNVLVKADYAKKFVPIIDFSKEHVLKKYRLWIQLCLALGAKKVSVIDIEEISLEEGDSASLLFGAGLKTPPVKSDANLKRKISGHNEEARNDIMKIKAEADGSVPNLVDAERIIKEYGLYSDDMFTDIVELRKLSSNPVTSHELSLDCSKDFKKIFDSSTEVKIELMYKIFKGKVEFNNAKKSFERNRSVMKLSVRVEF